MTDEHLTEQDVAAPAPIADLADLRTLLQSLPPPAPPTLVQARGGFLGDVSNNTAASQTGETGLSLTTGTLPSSTPGSTIGPTITGVGPGDRDLDIVYSGGRPVSVSRHDGGILMADTTISYVGLHIASVVVVRHDIGKTITVVPIYTGDDITHIDRTVT